MFFELHRKSKYEKCKFRDDITRLDAHLANPLNSPVHLKCFTVSNGLAGCAAVKRIPLV